MCVCELLYATTSCYVFVACSCYVLELPHLPRQNSRLRQNKKQVSVLRAAEVMVMVIVIVIVMVIVKW